MPRLTEMRPEETYPGAEYSADEVEFMMAMERYKRRASRPFPTWHEVLRVVKALGYRKIEVQKSEPPRSQRPRRR
ncbi:MAG: hypothetical protein ACJ8F7_21080 [Gemmataceae bacterium]